jgi:uncharacterized protein YigE (DUF2233 family)
MRPSFARECPHAPVLAGLLAAMVLAAVPAGAAAADAARRPLVWERLGPGIERATLHGRDGAGPVLLLRFALKAYQAEIAVGDGWPPRLATAAELRRHRGAVAAVNGGFFDERHRPLGLRLVQGRPRVPFRRKVDWGVLLLEGGKARIVHSRDRPAQPSALGAIQVGPRLVVAGKALKLKPQWARRTAVALDSGGGALTLVIADTPVEANELAARLAASGFDSALLLDGGPSTQLSLAHGDVEVDIPGGYPVPDLLLITKR